MATKHQKLEIELDSEYTDAEREAIAYEIIERIRQRSLGGQGVYDGEIDDFPEYSDAYVKSTNFRIAGKNEDDVNLTLSGDMLASIEILENREGKIVIGYQNGSNENAKADGNMRGTYGKDKENPSKARRFLDITDTELNSILENYPIEGPERDESLERAELVQLAQEKVDEFVDEVKSTRSDEYIDDEGNLRRGFRLRIGKR